MNEHASNGTRLRKLDEKIPIGTGDKGRWGEFFFDRYAHETTSEERTALMFRARHSKHRRALDPTAEPERDLGGCLADLDEAGLDALFRGLVKAAIDFYESHVAATCAVCHP